MEPSQSIFPNYSNRPGTNTPRPYSSSSNKIWPAIKEWIQVIIVALVIALPVRYFVAEPFIVNGASMDPTFSTGQFLIVDRISYRFSEPKRGDVIVFEYPNNPSTYYIKRIIGLPGDTIAIKGGKVTIVNANYPNGLILDESYIDRAHSSIEDFARETLNSTEYFVMGDNRLQSSDSRVWGPLDEQFIVGRPIVRLLPFTSIGILPGKQIE